MRCNKSYAVQPGESDGTIRAPHPPPGLRPSGRLLARGLAVMLLLASTGLSTPEAMAGEASRHAVIRWATETAPYHEGLQRRLLEMDREYEVVFIPGIMGSRLEIGDFIWGESPVTAAKLALDPAQPPAKASVLETFQARGSWTGIRLGRVDIYGKGLDELHATLGGKEPKIFAYDWRQDLRRVADEFDRYAQEQLKGKRVVVIAHSMGGVMFWHWKNRRPLDQQPFTLLALVLLGSPLEGSCEIARMLIKGYEPYPGASGFEHLAYQLIFGEAHAALFTFPSVFQLLGRDDRRCAVLTHEGGATPQAFLDIEFWRRRFKGKFTQFAAQTGLPGGTEAERLTAYEARVAGAMTLAREFSLGFRLDQGDEWVSYLFSAAHPMPMRYILRAREGALEIDAGEGSTRGDGRVSVESATNRWHRSTRSGHIFQLDKGHGELLADPKLPIFLKEEIEQVVTEDRAAQISLFAHSDPALAARYKARGLLVSPAPRGLSLAARTDQEREVIAKLNLAGLAPAAEVSPLEARRIGRTLEDAQGKYAEAKVVYESAAILDPEGTDVRTLNRLGYILLREGKVGKATEVLVRAAKQAAEGQDPYLTTVLKAKLDRNLNAALVRSGFAQGAVKEFIRKEDYTNLAGDLEMRKQLMPVR